MSYGLNWCPWNAIQYSLLPNPIVRNNQLPQNLALRRSMLVMILGWQWVARYRGNFVAALCAAIDTRIRRYGRWMMNLIVGRLVRLRQELRIFVFRHGRLPFSPHGANYTCSQIGIY